MEQQSFVRHAVDRPVKKHPSRSMEWIPPPAGSFTSSSSTIHEYGMSILDGTPLEEVALAENTASVEESTPVEDLSFLDPGCVVQPKINATTIKVQLLGTKVLESVGQYHFIFISID
jgi:hypothetical protein